MPTLPKDRFPYSSPFTRPALSLPDGGRMIVWPVVNIEEWEVTRPMPRHVSSPPMGQQVIPDMPNWTWHEYGMRVGIWRLIEAFAAADIRPTLSINAKVCSSYPEVAQAVRKAAWEFMAHCYVQMPIHQIEDQRDMIRLSLDTLRDFTGKQPEGWLGPGRTQTFHTLDFVAEAGLKWFADWILDDQPFWVKTAHGPILSIPYSVELNDITIMVTGQHSSDEMFRRTCDAFDRLYEESASSTRVMAFGVHPYVTGAAHRIAYLEKMLDYMKQRSGVCFWSGEQIYDWYVAQVPAPA